MTEPIEELRIRREAFRDALNDINGVPGPAGVASIQARIGVLDEVIARLEAKDD